MYRDTYLGIYNYLRGQGEYEALESAAYVAEKYILGRPQMWSPEMITQIEAAVRLFKMNPVGAVAPDASLRNRCGGQTQMLSKRGKNYTVLFFNLISCSECAAWKQQLLEMKTLLREQGARVVSVYVGPDPDEWKDSLRKGVTSSTGKRISTCGCWWRDLRTDWPGSDLYQLYDLTTAPRLYLLDSSGTIIAKDITPTTLRELLSEL